MMWTILIMGVPALPLFAWSVVTEYWGMIYLYWGIIFTILSFIFSYRSTRCATDYPAKSPTTHNFFLNGILAWSISFIALGIINFSPLCLGQNNGDGNNTVGICIFYTIIWPVFMSITVVPLIYLASWVSQKVSKQRFSQHA